MRTRRATLWRRWINDYLLAVFLAPGVRSDPCGFFTYDGPGSRRRPAQRSQYPPNLDDLNAEQEDVATDLADKMDGERLAWHEGLHIAVIYVVGAGGAFAGAVGSTAATGVAAAENLSRFGLHSAEL